DAAADEEGAVAKVEGLLELTEDAAGDGRRLALVDVLEEEGKFVAAQARRGVPRPDRAGESLRDLLDEHVARVVTERVVDVLEVVQVEEEDRHLFGVTPLPGEGVLQAVDVEGAVRQRGQRIVERLAGQLLLELLP